VLKSLFAITPHFVEDSFKRINVGNGPLHSAENFVQKAFLKFLALRVIPVLFCVIPIDAQLFRQTHQSVLARAHWMLKNSFVGADGVGGVTALVHGDAVIPDKSCTRSKSGDCASLRRRTPKPCAASRDTPNGWFVIFSCLLSRFPNRLARA
jgi:hypothetical protein